MKVLVKVAAITVALEGALFAAFFLCLVAGWV